MTVWSCALMLLCAGNGASLSAAQPDTTVAVSDTTMAAVIREMPPIMKLEFSPERNYDLSVLPVLPGTRETPDVEVGKFNKLQGEFVETPQPRYGAFDVGYGMYNSIAAGGWLTAYSGSSDLLAAGRYTSTNGKESFQEFYRAEAALTAHTSTGNAPYAGTLRGEFGFSTEGYKLYGSPTPERERTLVQFRGGVVGTTHWESGSELTGAAEFSAVRFTDILQTKSTTGRAEVSLKIPIGAFAAEARAEGCKSAFSAGSDPQLLNAGINISRRFVNIIVAEAGASVAAVKGSDGRSHSYLFGNARFTWFASRGITFVAAYTPDVGYSVLDTFLRANPYLSHATLLRHAVNVHRISISGEVVFSEKTSAKLTGKYRRVENMPIFSQVGQSGVWELVYAGHVQMYEVDASLLSRPAVRGLLEAGATYRRTRVEVTDKPAPYTPEIEGRASYQHAFSKSVRWMATMTLRGTQYADIMKTRRLRGQTVLNTTITMDLSRAVSLTAFVWNVLDSRRPSWEGYAGPPRTAGASVSVSW